MVTLHNVYGEIRQLETDEGSVLRALDEAQIVSFDRRDDKVVASESCDNYFSAWLSKDQLSRLIDELQAIHDEMQ